MGLERTVGTREADLEGPNHSTGLQSKERQYGTGETGEKCQGKAHAQSSPIS